MIDGRAGSPGMSRGGEAESPSDGWRRELTLRTCAGERDVVIVGVDDSVTVGEVLDALEADLDQCWVDGVYLSRPWAMVACAALKRGSVIDLDSTTALRRSDRPRRRGGVELVGIAGPLAGRVVALSDELQACPGRPSTVESGEPPERPRSVAVGAGQAWGRVVSVPGHVFALRSTPNMAAGAQGAEEQTGVVVRGPSIRAAPLLRTVDVPSIVTTVPQTVAFSWATLLAPVPVAVLMAVFFRPLFALFAALGPMMSFGRWYEARVRVRRARARRQREVDDALVTIAERRRELAAADLERRRGDFPDLVALEDVARSGDRRLWATRPVDELFGAAALAVGDIEVVVEPPSDPSGPKPDAELLAAACAPLVVEAAPDALSLFPTSAVGLVGPIRDAARVAASIVLQLATRSGPSDLEICVIGTDRHGTPDRDRWDIDGGAVDEWDWVKWLPHHVSGETAPGVRQRLSVLLSQHDPEASDHLAAGAVISIATSVDALPERCETIVTVDGGEVAVVSRDGVACAGAFRPAFGVAPADARRWARSLGRRRDPDVDIVAGRGPAGVPKVFQSIGVEELRAQWKNPPAGLPAVLGADEQGEFRVDLVDDGPHALIAGSTGSGKSELLRSLVLSLVLQCPPCDLRLVLIDFKGGGTFDALARMPHVAGVVTDLDGDLVRRCLAGLSVELRRREHTLRELACSSWAEARERGLAPGPALVVVADEFAALAKDHRDELAALIDLAARGRSLGMHLVLATQRPAGVVDARIRSNTAVRIALRVESPADSSDVLGVADAAVIDRRRPGTAIAVVGGDTPVRFRGPDLAAPVRAPQRCVVTPFARRPIQMEADPAVGRSSLLHAGVAAVVDAAVSHSPAPPLWCGPLPQALRFGDLQRIVDEQATASGEPSTAEPQGVAVGLSDDPARQQQQPWWWRPAEPTVLVAPTADQLEQAAATLAASYGAQRPVEVHSVGMGACTEVVGAGLPAHGAVLEIGEVDRVCRLLRWLVEAVDEWPTAGAAGSSSGAPGPVLLRHLAIADLGALLAVCADAADAVVENLGHLARRGAAAGLSLSIGARSVRDVPSRLLHLLTRRLVFAGTSAVDCLTLGVEGDMPAPAAAGSLRAVDAATGHSVQLVTPPTPEALRAIVTWSASSLRASRLRSIPAFGAQVAADALPVARVHGDRVTIALGVDARDVAPVTVQVGPSRPLFIASSPRAGRTSVCDLLAERAADAAPAGLRIVRVDGHSAVACDELRTLCDQGSRALVVIDNAERLDASASDLLAALDHNSSCSLVIATSMADARSTRSPVSRFRRSGDGLLVGGTHRDGDILRVALSRLDGLGQTPGRGHLVASGRVIPLQLATVSPAGHDRAASQ